MKVIVFVTPPHFTINHDEGADQVKRSGTDSVLTGMKSFISTTSLPLTGGMMRAGPELTFDLLFTHNTTERWIVTLLLNNVLLAESIFLWWDDDDDHDRDRRVMAFIYHLQRKTLC